MTNTSGVWHSITMIDAAIRICTGLGDDLVTFNASGATEVDRIRHLLNPDMQVLDFGGGIGRVARHLAPLVASVEVMDVSPSMLAFGEQWCAGLDNVHFTMNEPDPPAPAHDNTFDLVVSHMTFFHLHYDTKNYTAWMDEMWRVLKPEGLFWFDVDVDTKYPAVDDAKWLLLKKQRLPGWNGHDGFYYLLRKSNAALA